MNEFESLLENYINLDEMDAKLHEDLEEILKENENNNSNKKSSNSFIKTITIQEFVVNYLGTNHDCKNLKHKGLKSFKNPYVIGIPNDFASKNPDHVIRNEILVVLDSYGNPGTYINPVLLKKMESFEECKQLLRLINKIRIQSFSEVTRIAYVQSLILSKRNELEKSYSDSQELLKLLEKEKVYFKIIKDVRNGKDYSEYLEQLLNMDNDLKEIEANILNSGTFSKKSSL